jgi:putative oxygen-independent coproporphyrinogen III oxidase
MSEAINRPPLALYIHWPFCASKCPYCDFNSHVRNTVDHAAWRTALLAELAYEAALTPGHELVSIFFGGGTPSLMHPSTVAALIEHAKTLWPHETLEITLEANPNSVEADRFAAFAAAGINRVSIGIQSFDDAALKFLGRLHSADEARHAIDIAQRHFSRVSFDLIYALPGQTPGAWRAQLENALALGTEHLSLYQLTIEQNTGFAGKYARGEFILPDEDQAATLFDMTRDITAAAGLPLYEISNHAKPGAQSRHNLMYWTYGDYIGIGPGAHGRRLNTATARVKKPETWLAGVTQKNHGMDSEILLDNRTRADEALLMGLRLASGMDAAQFERRTGLALPDILDSRRVENAIAEGLLIRSATHLAASPRGMLLLNALLADISL